MSAAQKERRMFGSLPVGVAVAALVQTFSLSVPWPITPATTEGRLARLLIAAVGMVSLAALLLEYLRIRWLKKRVNREQPPLEVSPLTGHTEHQFLSFLGFVAVLAAMFVAVLLLF